MQNFPTDEALTANSVAPNSALAQDAITLERKLRMTRDLMFVVCFVEDQRASNYIKSLVQRLARELCGAEMVEVSASSPDNMAAETLIAIFDAGRRSAVNGLRPPVWIEAFRGPGDPAWEVQRTEFLMRFNECRNRFEKELRCPMILLLPAGAMREIARWAPDMWHIRLHTAVLDGVGLTPQPAEKKPLTLDESNFLLPIAQPGAQLPSVDNHPATPPSGALLAISVCSRGSRQRFGKSFALGWARRR
jgi:hypothetical protein